MTTELYFSIGLAIAILFFTITILNLMFKFTDNEIFTAFTSLKEYDNIFVIVVLALLLSMMLSIIWIIFIPSIILYPIIKLIRYINWKKVWIEIQKTGRAARLARDNQYNKQ